jgi:RecB family exonuclease
VALLRSPHFQFEHAAGRIVRDDVSALDHALSGARYLGDLSRLDAVAAHHAHSLPALHAALAAARELEPLLQPAAASVQLGRLVAFIDAHVSPIAADDPFAVREARGRLEIRSLLAQLADAHARLHDPEWAIADLASAVRRWISEQTSEPERIPLNGPGVSLVDEQAARYGSFDELVVVGLVENEWPERSRRNIFYGTGLLKALGWPSEKDRRGGADARFVDLLRSARARTILSTFTLDDEAPVTRSTQLDEVPRARLTAMPIESDAPGKEDITASGSWVDLRSTRTSAGNPAYHGQLGPQSSRPWSVSSLETYIGCPFKFFAQHVLRLHEEPDDEEVMDPRRQGQFVHEVFEQFFDQWQKSGRRAITADNLDEARTLFEEVIERLIGRLPDGEAGLERTRLLGSPAAAGLGEAVFRMEAERPTAVVERLLEQKLDGALRIRTESGERTIQIRGKADRIDLLEDGTFRLIDYKLGWPPNKARALQLPIYALSVEQRLAGRAGKTWTLGEAAYLAFKGPRRVVPLFTSPAERDEALAAAEQRLADTIDAIERGEFPPTPDDVFRCETCSFASVCRTDYV